MSESPRPSERVVREMTADELAQAGIIADYWFGGPTYFRDGQEIDPHERVLLPVTDPQSFLTAPKET